MAHVKNTLMMNKPKVYSAENFRCQKCLEKGHFTYECSGKRKYVSRTSLLKKKLKIEENEGNKPTLKADESKDSPTEAKIIDNPNKMLNSSEHSGDSTSEDSESDSTTSSSSDSSSSSRSKARSRSRSGSTSSSSSSSCSSSNSSSSSSSSSNSSSSDTPVNARDSS